MSSAARWLGLLVIGFVLGQPVPVHAQTPEVKPSDLVGTWEVSGAAGMPGQLQQYFTFRPDKTSLHTTIRVADGDTLSCTDPGDWTPLTMAQKTVLNGEELSLTYKGGTTTVFKRVDPSNRPLNRVIAAGFAPGRPIPAHVQARTGTMADLLGAWEVTSGLARKWETLTATRRVMIVYPDSSMVRLVVRQVGTD